MPTKYEYDETKDSALSVMDGPVGQYAQSHQDDQFIFTMKDKTVVTFVFIGWKDGRQRGRELTIKDSNGEHTLIFSNKGEGKTTIKNGVSIKTDIGQFQPDYDMKLALQLKKVTNIQNLSIRQLYEISVDIIAEYKEFLKIMYGG